MLDRELAAALVATPSREIKQTIQHLRAKRAAKKRLLGGRDISLIYQVSLHLPIHDEALRTAGHREHHMTWRLPDGGVPQPVGLQNEHKSGVQPTLATRCDSLPPTPTEPRNSARKTLTSTPREGARRAGLRATLAPSPPPPRCKRAQGPTQRYELRK